MSKLAEQPSLRPVSYPHVGGAGKSRQVVGDAFGDQRYGLTCRLWLLLSSLACRASLVACSMRSTCASWTQRRPAPDHSTLRPGRRLQECSPTLQSRRSDQAFDNDYRLATLADITVPGTKSLQGVLNDGDVALLVDGWARFRDHPPQTYTGYVDMIYAALHMVAFHFKECHAKLVPAVQIQ